MRFVIFSLKSCVKNQNNNKTKQNLFGILMTSLLPVAALTAATMWPGLANNVDGGRATFFAVL
jgi:hypothetical protein